MQKITYSECMPHHLTIHKLVAHVSFDKPPRWLKTHAQHSIRDGAVSEHGSINMEEGFIKSSSPAVPQERYKAY